MSRGWILGERSTAFRACVFPTKLISSSSSSSNSLKIEDEDENEEEDELQQRVFHKGFSTQALRAPLRRPRGSLEHPGIFRAIRREL